ncbi:hypothetical protein PGIGA_G00251630 [Pangasianodon gigas]|uniref:Uncharacterized protein n=1 Tax=Pangasianodon gigas TaxID=30993 RepID=A0ACC5WQN2_PANGG|nr:hypothetical protein [Pangasianodon gigas]
MLFRYLLKWVPQLSCRVNRAICPSKHLMLSGISILRLCLSERVKTHIRVRDMRVVWTFLRTSCLKETVPWC